MNLLKSLLKRLNEIRSRGGLSHLFQSIIKHNIFEAIYYFFFKKNSKFKCNGKDYNYFYHPYNCTWENERSIEIPLAMDLIKKYDSKNILEIGNVISSYFKVNHDIVDKYEKSDGVINEDVVDYFPKKTYDLIISISTMEHVGYDEPIKEPEKIGKAILHLITLLNKGGTLFFTIPIGYNKEFDKRLENGSYTLSKEIFLEKISNAEWVEVSKENIKKKDFDFKTNSARVLFVGIYNKS